MPTTNTNDNSNKTQGSDALDRLFGRFNLPTPTELVDNDEKLKELEDARCARNAQTRQQFFDSVYYAIPEGDHVGNLSRIEVRELPSGKSLQLIYWFELTDLELDLQGWSVTYRPKSYSIRTTELVNNYHEPKLLYSLAEVAKLESRDWSGSHSVETYIITKLNSLAKSGLLQNIEFKLSKFETNGYKGYSIEL